MDNRVLNYITEYVSKSILPSLKNISSGSSKEIADSITRLKEAMSDESKGQIEEAKKEIKSTIEGLYEKKLATEYAEYLNKIEVVKGDKGDKGDIGERGEQGDMPSNEHIIEVIKPLIPLASKGEDGKSPTKSEIESLIKPLIPKVKDGKTPTKSELKGLIMPLIPSPIPGRDGYNGVNGLDGSPDKPKDIVAKLESLEGDNRLDAKAVKGLENFIGRTKVGFGKAVKYLANLLDVEITTPTTGQALVYNGITGKWVNATVAGSGTGIVETIVAGNNIDVDATDPANPIVSVETLTLADVSDVTASVTEINYVDGVTSAIQTQLNGKAASLGADDNYVTDAEKTKLSNLSGTNTGDQTTIVGITGTKAQFDTAVTDGNFLYVGDVTQYTDELAQDAVGTILTDSSEIDFTYNDGAPSITASIVSGSIDETKLDASTNSSLDLADGSLQRSGGTMSGNITLGENTSIALDPAGSADGKYSGTTVTGTGGATIAFGDLVTLDKDDSRWELVDISVAEAATGDARGIIGIAVTSSTDGGAITVLLNGIIRADTNFPALTIGAAVFASTTGDVVVTQPTTTDHVIRIVGYGLTADEMYFNPGAVWTTHT